MADREYARDDAGKFSSGGAGGAGAGEKKSGLGSWLKSKFGGKKEEPAAHSTAGYRSTFKPDFSKTPGALSEKAHGLTKEAHEVDGLHGPAAKAHREAEKAWSKLDPKQAAMHKGWAEHHEKYAAKE